MNKIAFFAPILAFSLFVACNNGDDEYFLDESPKWLPTIYVNIEENYYPSTNQIRAGSSLDVVVKTNNGDVRVTYSDRNYIYTTPQKTYRFQSHLLTRLTWYEDQYNFEEYDEAISYRGLDIKVKRTVYVRKMTEATYYLNEYNAPTLEYPGTCINELIDEIKVKGPRYTYQNLGGHEFHNDDSGDWTVEEREEFRDYFKAIDHEWLLKKFPELN